MSDEYVSDELLLLQLKRDRKKLLGTEELIAEFESGESKLEAAIEDYNNQFAHLIVNLRKAMNARETNPIILTRRYSGIRQRLVALDNAAFAIRGAYADIWAALEWALEDAPVRTASERARSGYVGKITKNEQSRRKAEAMEEIRAEWLSMKGGGRKQMTDADFARAMHAKHGATIKSEGSIKNAITRWRRESF